ncbi:leucyl aminopeptidase family protein [Aestuariibacter halophilus]|uniref:Leucyl aminopeptidase family protein n=1 Tax=Fluctibacter halophilus TaxID=226011 RepID=A0ABS8GBG7_9ALTE|nr:leucyl aminopeptidase family protein [Aestuariibacter halophilus]MCC2617892.1 leucyl aminopeptidase family protein [Aestuariibacter halophilus]
MAFPRAHHVADLSAALKTSQWDSILLITDPDIQAAPAPLNDLLSAHAKVDQRLGQQALMITATALPGSRMIVAPTGPLHRDYDDVRRVYDAARDGMQLAAQAGSIKPLVVVNVTAPSVAFEHALEVAYLGACQALWQPLEARQSLGEDAVEPVEAIGLLAQTEVDTAWLSALEAGRRVARDLCGTEPERMAPPGFASYCQEHFTDGSVAVSVIEDDARLCNEYPLLHAVARASVAVERHQPRVIRLEYTPEGAVDKTLYLAGKGITFDTGGADLKVGGHMAGMSRDKGGAAAVAGFMKVVEQCKPKGLKVVAELGAVRNSIGADAFVPDEIITSHAGVRVRVGNTDAEGRMVLADILSHLREEAVSAQAPELFSVATLTGHAAIAFGPYTALVENGAAKQQQVAPRIIAAGEVWGDPAEQSLSRREDFDFIRPRSKADDVLSSNNAPSVSTPRGHQFPMAFLAIASGLDRHNQHNANPLAYTHVDIAGSGVEKGDWQHGKPTAAPVVALAATYLRGR